MPILEIDGVGRVEVGNEFLKLSPEMQNQTVQEIASSGRQPAPGGQGRNSPTLPPGAQPGVAEDVAKSFAGGVGRGTAGLIGLPRWAGDQITAAMDWLEQTARQEGDEDFARRVAERKAKIGNVPTLLPQAATVQSGIESVTGPLHKPQTTAGRYASTVGEFTPGAMLGPGGAVRNAVNFAVAPGIASEAAGQITRGTPYETPARVGAAIATGGAAALVNRPRTVDQALRTAMGPNVDQQAVAAAAQLMDDAAARGVQLTWAEALEQVRPGAGLTNMQRVLESTTGSREVLSPVMAQRPQQVQAAARQTFDTIAPPSPAPSGIGPAVGEAAEAQVNQVRQGINQVSQPFYDAASTVRLTPQEMARVRALPGYEEARNAVRNDPQLNRYVANLPDDSVGFLNEVKKYFDQAGQNASAPVNAQRNMQRAAGYGSDAETARNIGVNAARDTGRNYETALAIQEAGRRRFLEPLLQGPLGTIAAKDTTTRQAINALFPANPLPNSAQEITTAVGALARRNQRATRDLIRAHAESTFNEAAQNLQGGMNQFGGAKFAAVIAGNPQQRANLEAAIRASGADGPQVWDGFERFLSIVQATGTRQPIGSKTAFNAQELRDLSTGGMIANAAKTGASPGKWLTAISEAWSRWQLGNNVEQLAQILVDPRSRNLLRAIASRPAGREAEILAGQLVLGANTARQGGSNAR